MEKDLLLKIVAQIFMLVNSDKSFTTKLKEVFLVLLLIGGALFMTGLFLTKVVSSGDTYNYYYYGEN